MATHILSLALGATTIPLYQSDGIVLDYMPQSAGLTTSSQGQEIYAIERQLVTETVRLLLYGESPAAVQSKIGSIERWVENVHRRQRTRTGDKGYLLQQLSSDTETWRSEVVSARLQPADENLRRWESGMEMLLVLTRRPFWETATERELPLDNGSAGAKATGGVTIYNHNDADANHDNWVDVAAVDVAGNLPAPLRLRMVNLSGAALATYDFYQAINTHYSPLTFDHIIEGESATYIAQVVSGTSSAGYFGRATWVTVLEHVVNLFVWPLSADLLAATGGGFYRILVRFANTPPSGIELQLHVKFPADDPLTTLWSGPKMIATGNALQDMGIVQLPPGIASVGHDSVALILTGAYTGTSQLDIDFVQITPAESSVRLRQAGYSFEANDVAVNDGPEDRVYQVESVSGYQRNIFQAYGSILFAWPNRDQRLIFLHDEGSSMNISRSWSVRAYYRPRRSTL